MRLLSLPIIACLLFAAPAASAPSAPPPQPVDIPMPGGLLHAYVYKPEGAGPFPLVIAVHDCGGLQGRTAQVRSRYRDWAEQLLKAGYAIVLPDSYGSRDLGPQCRVGKSAVRASHERVMDIHAARQWGAGQPWVQKGRIGLIGWGDGADALLWALRPQHGVRSAETDFRTAIAFYPDCRTPSSLGWSARLPTLVLIGADDDVSSPAACRQMIDGAKGCSAFAKIVAYPGAPHGFDQANVVLQSLSERPDADLPARGHIGTNVKARSDAQKRVARWLAR